ncbi:Dnaj domain protein-like protein [Leishmania tarentolae]|uniref:Dnaj domain protein-like protein n=1 Tax=Leishmania tarentolae TaxID=5689 RepID=A0A640KWK6_LEITA|nr:Dnaj domain protein-like protein [Leishmania tarentolae]GET93922.1 Dnaj domain protein-like protein [Leishmania tarentolae]
MLRRVHSRLLLPQRDPFKILGLTRSATKAEVKMKYRELARIYHPDAESGDSAKMEEVNHAYKLLLKEGAYERLHLPAPGGARAHDGNRPVGVTSESRRQPLREMATAPFTVDQQTSGTAGSSLGMSSGSASSPLTDEEAEKVSALDPTTERRTPEGKYLYQNRDDQSWVELDRPLLRAQQPHYASFSAQADMNAELRRRALLQEKEQNEKSRFQRAADRLADNAELPTKNPHLLRIYALVVVVVFFLMYKRTFERTTHQRRRTQFYQELEENREELMKAYEKHKEGLQATAVTAALVFLAAAEHKKSSDPVVPSPPEVFYRSVKPPNNHYTVIAGG